MLTIPDTILPGEAHLWELGGDRHLEEDLLPHERARWEKIGHAEARTGFVQAQVGLRHVLSHYQNCAPGKVTFSRTKYGKPYIPGGPHFNLSHTPGCAVVAVSNIPVGLDVERTDRRVKAAELAAKFFFPEEKAFLDTADDGRRERLFVRLWVCKEAMVKLSGDGIYHGLRDARTLLHGNGIEGGSYRGQAVALHAFSPTPGHAAALASWEKLHVNSFFRL